MGPMVQACRSPPCVTAALTKVFGTDIAAHGEHLRPICSVQLFIAKPNNLRSPADGIWREIWLEEAHHSTAIEGKTLVLKQVEALLAEGRAVGNKELSEYLEVRGYATAADWVYGHAIQPGQWTAGKLISVTELRHVHGHVMTPIWDVAP